MSAKAVLYRMETDQHICPFGLKSKDLLQRAGYEVEDHKLRTREETDKFQQQEGVDTTPQTYIDGERIGGFDELHKYLGKGEPGQQGTTYTPVIAIFGVALLIALALLLQQGTPILSTALFEYFVGLSMILLAVQKLRDLFAFSNSFITYDLLAMRWLRYAYIYPFLEAYAGLGMIAGLPAIIVAPASLFIGIVGAVSVFKAVYVDKRELKCACVGGDSNVPLGFVSLTENLFMIAAGIWMFVR